MIIFYIFTIMGSRITLLMFKKKINNIKILFQSFFIFIQVNCYSENYFDKGHKTFIRRRYFNLRLHLRLRLL